MADPQYSANHIINPETGFIENPAYPYAFDSPKKQRFLEVFQQQGLDIYITCEILGIERNTVIKHYHMDQAFKKAYDQAESEYASRLEGKSRRNAMNNDKSVIERIFQLNSLSRKGLTSGKYNEDKSFGQTVINMVVDGKALKVMHNREMVLEAQLSDTPQIAPNTEPTGVVLDAPEHAQTSDTEAQP